MGGNPGTPDNLPTASMVAALVVTVAVFIVAALSFVVNLSPPSYKSKVRMGFVDSLTGYFRWVWQHPRHLVHLLFIWLTVIFFEIPWGAGKGELRTILGDCWKNAIPAENWAKLPKGTQGLVSLALALTLKGTTSFDTLYLVPLGSALQFMGWFILYNRLGYTWSENNRTIPLCISQLCNVFGYSLQYIFFCPMVFNLTYLPFAPMSIGFSIMFGQGAQWIFQTLVVGPAEGKCGVEADKAAGDLTRKMGLKNGAVYPEDFDDILWWFMVSCVIAFVLSVTYNFVIRKYYGVENEPIEMIEKHADEDEAQEVVALQV